MKICLIASSGGHYEQLKIIGKILEGSNTYIISEETDYKNHAQYSLPQLNRKQKCFIFHFAKNIYKSFKIFLKEKPDIIISTGSMIAIPTFLIGKLYSKKLIFIESFAKVNTPTKTGKLLYPISDIFIIQWPNLKKSYPNGIYLGSIY